MVRNRNSYLGAPDGFKVLGILNVSYFGLETEVISIPVAGILWNLRGYFLQLVGYLLLRYKVVEDFIWQHHFWSYLSSRLLFLLLDNVKAFLGYIFYLMELLGYTFYGCTVWNISGILEPTDSFRIWYLLLSFHCTVYERIGLSPKNLAVHVIRPLGFYKQYFNLEMCTWMKRSEGNVWFFRFGSTRFPCWDYTPWWNGENWDDGRS